MPVIHASRLSCQVKIPTCSELDNSGYDRSGLMNQLYYFGLNAWAASGFSQVQFVLWPPKRMKREDIGSGADEMTLEVKL